MEIDGEDRVGQKKGGKGDEGGGERERMNKVPEDSWAPCLQKQWPAHK